MTTDCGRDPAGQALVASDEARSDLHPPGFDPSRKEKWRRFDEHYTKWQYREVPLPPAFIESSSEHVWRVQYLVQPDPPPRSWLYRLFRDPPIFAMAEPFYNGWPGDRRGWMTFPSKEAARNFYQMSNHFITLDEYRARPDRDPPLFERVDLDERGNFAIATEAGTATTTEIGVVHEGADPKGIAQ